MYMNQRINVNLTKENASKLERPSKVFNKIKAIFSGSMTPAETDRAQVMLSVLQRVNKSLRAANINHLVSLTVNEQLIYQDGKGVDSDLKEGVASFVRGNKISVFKRLEQIVKHATKDIVFVYDINVLQRPKAGDAPVTISVSGFPSKFALQEGESISDFETRVSEFVEKNFKTGEQVKTFNEMYLHAFNSEVERFTLALKTFFPAGCGVEKYKVRLLNRTDQTKLRGRIGGHFDSDVLFMHYWLNSETIESFDDGFELDKLFDVGLSDWFDNVLESNSEKSWTDDASESFSVSSDNESSCGSSCGSGCGD